VIGQFPDFASCFDLHSSLTNYSNHHIDLHVECDRQGFWRLTSFYVYSDKCWALILTLARMSNLP